MNDDGLRDDPGDEAANVVGRGGIEIPGEIADAAAMPDDLNANVFGPYAVPDPERRRRAAIVYVIGAAIVAIAIAAGLPPGMWVLAAGLLGIAGFNWFAGWRLEVREGEALEAANRAIGFPVGHASANLGFQGVRAKPIWNVLVFSAEEPPTQRGLVRVDAISGDVVEHYSETIPLEER